MTSEAVATVRKYLGSLSVMALRSVMLKLLEFLTNLDRLPVTFLATGTPSLSLLKAAVVDVIYGYSRGRQGIFLFGGDFSFL